MTQWTDSPRMDVVEHFQALHHNDQSFVDVLRYRFAGYTDVPLPFPAPTTKDPKTQEDLFRIWKSILKILTRPTPYDDWDIATATVAGRYGTVSNTLFQVFSGANLDTLLQTSSLYNIQEDDEPDSDDDLDDDFTTEDNKVSDIDAASTSRRHSEKDMKIYKRFLASEIGATHVTHSDLQYRTAAHVFGVTDAIVIFACPCPDCLDMFDASVAAYKFYQHLEHPKH